MHGIEAMEQHDNISSVTKRFVPTVAFHGQSDYAVSSREEQNLCTRLVLAGVPCEYHPLVGYGHDPTFACKCCATNCTKTGIVDCPGGAFERVKDGYELRLSGSNRTLDEQALLFLAANIGALSFADSV